MSKLRRNSLLRRTAALLSAAIIASALLCACGSGSYNYSNSYVSADSTEAAYGWYDMEYGEEAVAEEGEYSSDSVLTGRKIIKNRTMRAETVDYDEFISELRTRVTAMGGYIENSTEYGNSYYSSGLRSAEFTIRIPAANYESFTEEIGNLATVTYSYEYMNDVTSTYVDIEARLTALKTERDSFLAILEKADTVEDILKIQEYLTDVNYEIESYTARLNTYDDLISYSTINLSVDEVRRITTTVAEPTVGERIKSNLSDAMYNIGEGFKDAFVSFVSAIPYLVVTIVPIAIVVIIVVVIIKNSSKKKAAKNPPKSSEE